VFELAVESFAVPERFLIDKRNLSFEEGLEDPQNWDGYWRKSAGKSGVIYDLIAAFYRQTFIRRNLDKAIFREFPKGSELLHAGCGSGQVDMNLQHVMKVTALDISRDALRIYSRNNPQAVNVIHGSILDLPFPDDSIDGYYSLGVVEHFTVEEIIKIFREAHRVLKPGGKMVIFWPHRFAPSVIVLGVWHWFLKNALNSKAILHPKEISLLRSRKMAYKIIVDSGFVLKDFYYGPTDFFIQAIVVSQK
jgi:ubiquinone/menaquinone biosynthesis C-methylase UbiE